MDINRLGKEIQYYRKLRGLSQQELAGSICNQSEVSRIEAGKVFPTLQILYYMSLKLKVPITFLLEASMREREDYIREIKEWIDELVSHKNYEEVYELARAELKQDYVLNDEALFSYINWRYAVASYQTGHITVDQCIKKIEQSLVQTEEKFMNMAEGLDSKMRNSLAILYAEKQNYEKSFDCYETIIKQEKMLETDPSFLPKVYYNYGKTLFDCGSIEEAEKIVNQGIRQSVQCGNMLYIGQLYYQRGCCKEERNEASAGTDFIKAYSYMDEMGKENMKKIILQKKRDYFNYESAAQLYPLYPVKKL
ncbi:helix-turn-helix domain-containing protein [Alteribacillus sp. JSM 102045]|uniref:helix-turn-helix domain-containing protein n=1 Tax=Alteribacillus sp. JSM 102045 TaxID=1562101 RepID=UPI0035C0827E